MNIQKPTKLSYKGGAKLGQTLTPLQIRIVKEWEKKILVHPSYSSIAKKLGCSDETIHRTIKKYLSLKK